MKTVEQLLEKSVRQYRKVLEKTTAVEQAIQTQEPENILALSRAMHTAQDIAGKTDEELVPHFKRHQKITKSPLFHERRSLIEHIIELSESLTPKIRAIIAVKRDELQKITGGRAVMNGYHSNRTKSGSVINTSN